MPTNRDVVLRREQPPETVVERWKCGYTFVTNTIVVLFVVVGAVVFDFPRSDLVILVGGEELIAANDDGFHGSVGRDDDRIIDRLI